jgi:hypothetical protein
MGDRMLYVKIAKKILDTYVIHNCRYGEISPKLPTLVFVRPNLKCHLVKIEKLKTSSPYPWQKIVSLYLLHFIRS